MSTNADRNFVEHLTWDEVLARIDSGAAAILPIGAGAKQHGFHLPMNADRIQAEWFAARLADRIDCLIWPTVAYGYYPAFVAYAGSCSLSAPLFESLIEEITASLAGYGCRAVFLLDTGISTLAPVDHALVRLGNPGALHLKVHDGPRARRAAGELAGQTHGSHADELETSLMLALAPHLVDMAKAEASPAQGKETPGPLSPSDTTSPNYSRSGSFGDPTLATRAKGEVMLAAVIDDMVEQATAFIAARAAADNIPPRENRNRSR